MLAANGAIHHCGAGFNRDSARCSRSNSAIDYRKSGPVLIDVLQHLCNEVAILEWKTNMHYVTFRDRCRLINIYAECAIPALHNLQQRLANFAQAHDDNGLIHSFDDSLRDDKVVTAAGALCRQI